MAGKQSPEQKRAAKEARAKARLKQQQKQLKANRRTAAKLMGRPCKLTPAIQDQIAGLIESGDRPEVAAGVAGVSRTTFFDWMQKGAAGVEPFATFRTAVTRALDVFESDSRRVILEGDEVGVGFGPAKARLEVLSRRMPRHWAQQVKHHVEVIEDEFLDTLQRVCSDPAVHERVRQAQDCSVLFAAFCEALASRESETEAPLPVPAATGGQPVH